MQNIIDSMLEAIETIKRETGLPAPEYRMHPDDLAELRKEIKPMTFGEFGELSLAGRETMFGMRIILDSAAERLPIKK